MTQAPEASAAFICFPATVSAVVFVAIHSMVVTAPRVMFGRVPTVQLHVRICNVMHFDFAATFFYLKISRKGLPLRTRLECDGGRWRPCPSRSVF